MTTRRWEATNMHSGCRAKRLPDWKVRKPDGTVSAKQAAAGIMKRFLAAATRSGQTPPPRAVAKHRRHAQWHKQNLYRHSALCPNGIAPKRNRKKLDKH
jgi:hypothetical protein